ncbi:minor capsid protein [Psychrobacter sp. I-STPA6b]|uniref:minor capsid protein n=1 Tax=Psychrobacter sp. I-STPA6b TaxID=2585718 RepID=UPI001D0CB963|nr:minor capsid protein [Psychrobacter sp. I-STPA6b]
MTPEQFNKWQQSQVDIAQKEHEKRFYAHINSLSDDLKLALAYIDDLSKLSKRDIDKLIEQMLKAQIKRYSNAKVEYLILLSALADYISQTEALGLGIKPVKGLIADAVYLPIPASGLLLDEHIDNLVLYNNKRLHDTVRFAWANKQPVNELKDVIVGTAKARYTDGLIHKQKQSSKAMIDTANQHVMTTAKGETWAENGSYKYRILATLDYSTTEICRHEDGNLYEWGKGKVPPFHYYCRSVIIPELDEGFEWLRAGRTRASMYGPVDANIRYSEWIKDNPPPEDWKPPKRPKRRRPKPSEVKQIERVE